jgi:hypothetical protein
MVHDHHDAGFTLPIVLRCAEIHVPRARYVFDTLLMASGIQARYVSEPPGNGPWLLYAGSVPEAEARRSSCVVIAHCPSAWQFFEAGRDAEQSTEVDGMPIVLPLAGTDFDPDPDIRFDLVANAFYFLASWSERVNGSNVGGRQLHAHSVFTRLGLPQDIVDRYLECLLQCLGRLCDQLSIDRWPRVEWPDGARYALVLSHDIDFLPAGPVDVARQGAKTALRHLLRERDPADALRAMAGLASACLAGRDPYGCVPEIIERERALGVRSSFQVAVGHRHPHDVNYRIENDRVRDYLRSITDAGFDLCLHGSVRSTESPAWYVEEAALLERRLGRPRGSRQHFLSFDYDALFSAQEQAGIHYDMSMGFPDQIGPRAGFSHPYFPYCIEQERPYDVLQISLFLMDVTLRGYMGLKLPAARQAIEHTLDQLSRVGGCASAVWHPIVFGGARDPGYDELYWRMVSRVRETGGLATDGRTINAHVRRRASGYASFAQLSSPDGDLHAHLRSSVSDAGVGRSMNRETA